MMKQLTSPWGETVDPLNVLKEYPRPQLQRDSYLNLNGVWDFELSKSPEISNYSQTILVPFAPESALSGVQAQVEADDYLHYRKLFSLPENFLNKWLIIHFEAVDQECDVFLNGIHLGSHKGGYTSFQFKVAQECLKESNDLCVVARDWTEDSAHARGKQKRNKNGKMSSLFYTPTSGIWQSVWMESVGDDAIESLVMTPDYDAQTLYLEIQADTDQDCIVSVASGFKEVLSKTIPSNQKVGLYLSDMIPWTPETPFLYTVKIKMGSDTVKSYFGMRKFSIGKDRSGILRFELNNTPYFFNGVLDQGYWPESQMTAPSDGALIYDIETLKGLGFNTIRKHVKVESARFYAHCDRLGMVVWQDMPNGGGAYSMPFVTYLPNALTWTARWVKDHHYNWFKRTDEVGRDQYYKDLESMIKQHYNHPSIAMWVPFNEGWGQFDAKAATQRIRTLDKTRLINEACGWFDQGGGDVYSIHNYLRKLKIKPQKDCVVALTEFGGFAFLIQNHTSYETQFGYRHYKTQADFNANYEKLWLRDIIPNIQKGLSATIYTQISDIEEEINGLCTYDRRVLKVDETLVRTLNARVQKVFNDK